MTNTSRGGPLHGVRVVELAKVWAGPCVGKQLAFLGAEVIKIESEGSLDVTRTFGVDDIDNSPGFQSVNPQKLSVQIDMKSKAGIGLALDLIAKADIFVENLRPGAIDRMGLGYDVVKAANPSIVFVSMGMYGNDGPLANQTGYAPCFNALAGLAYLVGYEGGGPMGVNMRYGDSTFGAAASYAAVVALMHKRKTGEGQFIDVSAVETLTSMIGDAFVEYAVTGEAPKCHGARHPEMAPHGVFPCKDEEWISIAVTGDAAWTALASLMGQPELAKDKRFKTLKARKKNEDELERLVSEWTGTKDALGLELELQRAGIASAKSQNSVDLISDQHLWARGFYPHVPDNAGHPKPIIGPSWKMSRGAVVTSGAPRLGEHNDYVLGDILGLSADERKKLREAGTTR